MTADLHIGPGEGLAVDLGRVHAAVHLHLVHELDTDTVTSLELPRVSLSPGPAAGTGWSPR